MMALLRFFNISAVRVGGNTDFEGTPQKIWQQDRGWTRTMLDHVSLWMPKGDDDKHHLHNDGIGGPLKAKAQDGQGMGPQDPGKVPQIPRFFSHLVWIALFQAFRSFETAKGLFEDEALRIVGRTSADASMRVLDENV